MREIKFRAWDKKNKKMFFPERIMFDVRKVDIRYGKMDVRLIDFEDVELMQYTGLKDKNGKEIYEGDICKKDNTQPIEIVWNKTGWGCKYKYLNDWVVDVFLNDLEVIGNIYENPKLLK